MTGAREIANRRVLPLRGEPREQRPRGEGAPRVQPRRGAKRRPGLEPEDPIRLYRDRHSGGIGHLVHTGREAAFGWIVERGGARPGGRERGLDDEDSGRVESGSRRFQRPRRNSSEALGRQHVGKHSRTLDRYRADLHHRVARAQPAGRHRALRRDPQHLTHHEWLTHRARDLGVTPNERRSHPVERSPHPREQRLRVLGGRPFGQQHACEKPPRSGSRDRDVVRIDGDGVGSDPGAGKGDGVRRRDERPRLDLDGARVLADARPEHDLGRKGCLDETREKFGGELARGQRRRIPCGVPGAFSGPERQSGSGFEFGGCVLTEAWYLASPGVIPRSETHRMAAGDGDGRSVDDGTTPSSTYTKHFRLPAHP